MLFIVSYRFKNTTPSREALAAAIMRQFPLPEKCARTTGSLNPAQQKYTTIFNTGQDEMPCRIVSTKKPNVLNVWAMPNVHQWLSGRTDLNLGPLLQKHVSAHGGWSGIVNDAVCCKSA